MKTVIFILALFSCTLSISQKPADLASIDIPDSTALGSPDGNPVSKAIGPAGGNIVSGDGRIELIFPAGALTATTTIQIQPTTNPAPNGSGKAYWFQPSGTKFSKPVKMILHYTEEEAEECPPELMAMATQDQSGKWTFFDYDKWDSTTHTLHGFIDHFSGAAKVKKYSLVTSLSKLALDPEKKKLPARDRMYVMVVDITQKIKPRNQYLVAGLETSTVIQWYVNDILNGDRSVGEIKNEDIPLFTEKMVTATYSAPDYIPAENPVRIAAAVYVYNTKAQEHKFKKYLTCKVAIYDQYRVEVYHQFETRVGMGNQVVDVGSFVATVYCDKVNGRKTFVDSVKNFPPVLSRRGRKNPCKLEIMIDEYIVGSVDIRKNLSSNKLIEKQNQPPRIILEWEPESATAFRFQWHCPGNRPTPITAMPIQTVPTLIEFMANGQPQFIPIDPGGQVRKYTIDIKPLRPRTN